MRTFTILIALSLSSTAVAEPDAYVERPLTVSAHVGLGTPLGFYGIAAELAVLSALSIEGGVGSGMSGTQVAAQARVRLLEVSRTGRLALGVGFSEGHYQHREPFYGIEYMPTVVDRAYWANAELSIESRLGRTGAWGVRAYLGLGTIVAGQKERCWDGDAGTMACTGTARGLWNPYVGLSLGYAFGI